MSIRICVVDGEPVILSEAEQRAVSSLQAHQDLDLESAVRMAIAQREDAPEPGACRSCHRIEERTERGIRPIRLTDGICAACVDADAEIAAEGPDDAELPQAARKMWS